jgi:Sensors of blue-light using FAD
MPANLHALIYVSHSNSDINDDTANAMIQDILSTSRSKNLQLEITGALLYSEGCFTQILEGEKADVEAIYGSIQRDVRHRDMTLLSFKPTPRRHFPEWSMAYAGVSAHPDWATKIRGLLGSPAAIDGDQTGRQLVGFMTDLIRQQEADRPAFQK